MHLNESQSRAIAKATSSRFAMITGGAGTGKTTIIKQIADSLKQTGLDVSLCAFAGKAAARLREATGHHARTIHSMLKYNGAVFMAGTLDGKNIIIDEASMVDGALLAEVVKRRPRSLILVGDPAQLPPVGKGQPFHDLINIRPADVQELTTCYRNREAVYKAASAIREGSTPLHSDETPGVGSEPGERWEICNTGDAKTTHEVILEYARTGFIDFERDIILVPRNGENADMPCTVNGLNSDIVDLLNPREPGEAWRAGDRVICTKNFPDKDIWNGTTGTISSIDSEGLPWVHLDIPITDESGAEKQDILLEKEHRKALQLAYALTVHKSQGSQYRRVIFVALHRDSFALLDRSLIYTAVTRAREQCVVVGQYGALVEGIRTVKRKRTVIQEISI